MFAHDSANWCFVLLNDFLSSIKYKKFIINHDHDLFMDVKVNGDDNL